MILGAAYSSLHTKVLRILNVELHEQLDASCERRIRKKNYVHGAIFSDLIRNLTPCVAQKTFLILTFSISGIFVLHVNVNSKVEPLLTQKT